MKQEINKMSNLTINKLMNKFRHRDNKVTIQKS